MQDLKKIIYDIAAKKSSLTIVENIDKIQQGNNLVSTQTDLLDLPLEPRASSWKNIESEDYHALFKMYEFSNLKHMKYFLNEAINNLYRVRKENYVEISENYISVTLYTPTVNDVTEVDIHLSKTLDDIYSDISFFESSD